MPLNTPETLDTIEAALDRTDETLETLERIPKVHLNGTTKKQQYIILGTTAVAAAIAGGTVGYLLSKRRWRKFYQLKYQEVSDREIAAAKKFYAMRYKKDGFSTPAEALEKVEGEKSEDTDNEFSDNPGYEEKLGGLKYKVETTSKEDLLRGVKKGVKKGVEEMREEVEKIPDRLEDALGEGVEEFDYETELMQRTADGPYIITLEEFTENEPENTQETLTYFEEDDTLLDQRDQMVDDIEAVVGIKNVSRFGYGSKDKNTVYVRNNRIEMDFEIVRSQGSYVKEVLGFIEHSEERATHRRKRRDRE